MKGRYEAPPIVERWNPFSRIRVIGDPARTIKPSGWGFSTTLPAAMTARELHLDIDSYAGTELTAFNGDTSSVGHLKYDVTNVVHYLRPSSDVVVVGTGGGRDILSALVFNQRHVTGVEINPSILELVNGRFGDFTGHLDRDPRVRFVNDEARSYLARMTERADIIQISLIDTWAATASGAFVLTENSLYTLEAWTRFLDRLSPRGVLSVSRWYYADRPGEVYRSAVLAMAALQRLGATRPQDHFAIVRARPAAAADAPDGIGTILVSRDPLTPADLDTLESVAARLKFDIVQSPRTSIDDTFAAIASADRLPALLEAYPLDISAPTDDSPFFFHMLRLRDVFDVTRWQDQGIVSFNMKAVGVLGVLLATVLLMTTACIVFPLLLTRRSADARRRRALPAVFRRDRARLHADRDLAAAAADDLSRSSGVQPVGRAVLVAGIERHRQPVHRACDGSAGVDQAAPGVDDRDAHRLRAPDTADRPPVRVIVHTGTDRAGDRAAVSGGILHGHGVPPGHAPRAQARAAARAVVLGRQRRRVGVCIGARGGDRDRRGDLGGVLDGDALVIWWRSAR